MRLSDLARVYDLIDSPIAYHRAFVAIAESVSGAVFLSQVCYWSRRTRREDGFFYKTAEEWTEETGIPLQTQRRIREKLREKGILIEKLIGVPATLYFKLDAEALIKHLSVLPSGQTESDQVVKHLVLPSGQTISETTTETTNTSDGEIPLAFPKPQKKQKSPRGYLRPAATVRTYDQTPRESASERRSREASEQVARLAATVQARRDRRAGG